MEPLDVFTVNDLSQRPDDLLRDAEQGRLTLITKDGRPAILAVPFDQWLVEQGVHRAVALHLFESGQITLARGARLAGLSLEEFIEILGKSGVAVVDYPPEELASELEAARCRS